MKKILVICPYDHIYPPMNGGMQRCINILHQLAKQFNVTAIIHQDKAGFQQSFPSFPALAAVELYSTQDEPVPADLFSLLPGKIANALRYRWYKKDAWASSDGNFLLYYPVLSRLLRQIKFDAIVLENLATINAVSVIRHYDKRVPVIYDAHNVDTSLLKANTTGVDINPATLKAVALAESNLYKNVSAAWACSEQDRLELLALNQDKLRVDVIPNGVTIKGKQPATGDAQGARAYIMFFGSLNYYPNEEAIDWFYKNAWPMISKKFPDLQWVIAGSGERPASLELLSKEKNILFTGRVDDLGHWYQRCALAIAPLQSGSGTRLKILEAMGYGVPVVATTKGAEGIGYTNGENILVADEGAHFAEAVTGLLENPEERNSMAAAGYQLVATTYDWNLVGLQLKQSIAEIIAQQASA